MTDYFLEFQNAEIGGNTTAGGAPRDAGSSPVQYSKVSCHFLLTSGGSYSIQASTDGATWFDIVSGNLNAGKSTLVTVPLLYQYHRPFARNGNLAGYLTMSLGFS